MSDYPITSRNEVKRLPKRAVYDRDTVHRIIDEALVCHVGFVQDQQPLVIPTLHARRGETLFLHGAKRSRLIEHVRAGNAVCAAFTLLDGIVLARSAFHHSVNYRSVVLFGRGNPVEGDEDKLRALEAIVEHVAKGRWHEARRPNRKELDATAVVAIEIEAASAKVRSGPPVDDEEDYQLPVWAGVLPLALRPQSPIADPRLPPSLHLPDYLADYMGRGFRPPKE